MALPTQRGSRARDPRLLAPLALLAAACGAPPAPPAAVDLPRLADENSVDPLVRERVRAALAACEKGNERGLLQLAFVYESNEIDTLAERAYALCVEHPELVPRVPPAEVHFHRGRNLAAMGRHAEAIEAYAASLALDQSYVPAFWRSAQLLLDAGRLDEARARLDRALALEPESVAARLALARLQLIQDDAPGAIATLGPVVARQANERFAHGLLSRAYQALGDVARSEEERVLEENADHVTMADPRTAEMRGHATGILTFVQRANAALAQDNADVAVKMLEPLRARFPEDLAIAQVLAKSLVQAEQPQRALALLAKSTAVHPDDYKLELYTGLALRAQHEPRDALAHLLRARELHPDYPPTHALLGEVQQELGMLAEAEESFAWALKDEEVELQYFLALGKVQCERKAWDRAAATFERATREHPEAAAAWVNLAEAQARSGARDAASASLAEAERRNASQTRIANVRRILDGSGAR